MLTQVRERALATTPQFTDAQVAALLKLLKNPTTIPTVSATSSELTFLDAPYTLYEGTGQDAWQSAMASAAGVPDGATSLLVEVRWVLFGKVGDTTRNACWRIDSAKGNGADPTSDTFILASGTGGRDSNVDGSGGSSQGLFPVNSDGSFDYLVNSPGYGWTDILIRIIGYQAPSS